MPNPLCRAILAAGLLMLVSLPVASHDSPPLLLQLRLFDNAGQAISGGRFLARFSFYDADLTDLPLYEVEVDNLSARNGLVSVQLRLEDRINDLLFYDQPEDLFSQPRAQVGVTIIDGQVPVGLEVGEELFPRIPIAAVPFAMQAKSALSIGGATVEELDQSEHLLDEENPHGVSAVQIGAARTADVDNALADKADRLHGHDERYHPRSDVDELIEALAARVEALEAAIDGGDNEALARFLAALSVDGETLRLDGVNLQLTSGAGLTHPLAGGRNGLGNLIIGYNAGANLERVGTHNLVIGDGHSWPGSAGMVQGEGHRIGDRAVALGGFENRALGGSVAIGGFQNRAQQRLSVLIGGVRNESVEGEIDENGNPTSDGVIIGGEQNRVSGTAAVAVAGRANHAIGTRAATLGGQQNRASGVAAVAVSGRGNEATGPMAAVAGGLDNEAIGELSTVVGGVGNVARGARTTITAGQEILLEGDDELQDILAGITRLEGDDLIFEGVNIHLRNGSGLTHSANGLGNLIVGYNEAGIGLEGLNGGVDLPDISNGSGGGTIIEPPPRTGSHNIVLGPAHEFTSFGSLLTGMANVARAPGVALLGGHRNLAQWPRTVLAGGTRNIAGDQGPPPEAETILIGGGVLGGVMVEAIPGAPAAVGGSDNSAAVKAGTAVGGSSNRVSQPGGVIAGGSNRGGNP